MTKQDIGIIICRSLALYIFVTSITNWVTDSFPYFYQQLLSVSNGIMPRVTIQASVSLLFSLLIPIGIAVVIWICSEKLSHYIIYTKNDRQKEKINTNITSFEIQTIVFSSIGLFLLAQSLPQFIIAICGIFIVSSTFVSQFHYQSFTILGIIYSLTGVVTGLLLFIKASKLSEIVSKIK